MGNSGSNSIEQKNSITYEEHYTTLDAEEIIDIRQKYKVVDVKWLDKVQVNSSIFGDEYFTLNPHKEEVLNDMVEHFITHKDKGIYKRKTNYLCNRKEQLCICNTMANDFRKIYDGSNYTDDTFISWIKKTNEPF